MVQAQTLKGFRDFLPSDMRRRLYVINTLRKVFEVFGFEPLETPALEYEEILLGKYGEEGDKLMYKFTDNGERRVALRYDQTVPLARVVAQYGNTLPTPFKRYQIQPVWRAENTQKGRFREFLQCDIDTVGINSPLSDAEIIQIVVKSLENLGFKNFKVILNDRENLKFYGPGFELSEEKNIIAVRALDKIKKIGRESVLNELVEKGFGREEATFVLQKSENTKPTQRLEEIFDILEKSGVSKDRYEFSPTLARGMDYYTGIILEVEVEEYSAGSLGGGGRYDKLVGMFTKTDIPAVGFAFGFDRLIEVMNQLDLFPKDLTTTKVLITIFSQDSLQASQQAALKLRSEDINTELWLDASSKLEKQLKYADSKNIPYAVIIGPEEVTASLVTLKNLKDKTQERLTIDETITRLTNDQ